MCVDYGSHLCHQLFALRTADTNRGRHRLYVALVRLVQQLVRGLECVGLIVRQWWCWWRGQSNVQRVFVDILRATGGVGSV